jgi:hypothetical protein
MPTLAWVPYRFHVLVAFIRCVPSQRFDLLGERITPCACPSVETRVILYARVGSWVLGIIYSSPLVVIWSTLAPGSSVFSTGSLLTEDYDRVPMAVRRCRHDQTSAC